MVESLKELNQVCQKPRYKEVGNWMVRTFLRDAALPCTWVLLHTPITANQVTMVALLVGLWGNFLLAGSSTAHFVFAVICLQLWYYLDHVDGQIARYRKTSSLTGRVYDFLMHHVVHGTVFFPLGWFMWQTTENELFLALSFLMSVSMMAFNMMSDVMTKAFFEKIMKEPSFRPRGEEASEPSGVTTQESSLKKLFSLLHKACEMHVLMNVLTIAALLELFILKDVSLRTPLFWFYAFALALLTPGKIFFWIKHQKPDEEFGKYFKS